MSSYTDNGVAWTNHAWIGVKEYGWICSSAGCKPYSGYFFSSSTPASTISDSRCAEARSGVVAALSEFPLWMVIMMAVLAVAIIVGAVMYIADKSELDISFDGLGPAIFTLLISGIIIVLAIIIVSSLC